MAGAQDHQVGQLGHHLRVLLNRGKEGLSRQTHQLAVTQGDHRGGVRRAGDHRHLARRLAGADHPQEVRLLTFVTLHHAQASGDQEVEAVGVLPRVEQHPPARQREPRRLGRASATQEQPGEGRVLEVGGQLDHDQKPSLERESPPAFRRRLSPGLRRLYHRLHA